MKKSLKQLETDVKNAKKEKNPLPNDRFSEVMTDFSNQAKVKIPSCPPLDLLPHTLSSLPPPLPLLPNGQFSVVMTNLCNQAKVKSKKPLRPNKILDLDLRINLPVAFHQS